MADTKLSALPAAGALGATDLMYVVQGGVSKQATGAQITALGQSGLGTAAFQSSATFLQASNNLSDVASASTALATLGGAPAWFPGYVSSRWYMMPGVPAVTTASALAANTIYFVAFPIYSPMTIKALGARINTASAGGNLQLAIYASLNGQPNGAPLASTSSISTTSAGNVSATLGSPVTLNPGVYWAAVTADNSTVAMQGVNGASPLTSWLVGAASQNLVSDSTTTSRPEPSFGFTYASGSWPTLSAGQTSVNGAAHAAALQLQAN